MEGIQAELATVTAKHTAHIEEIKKDCELVKEEEVRRAKEMVKTEMQAEVDRACAERDEHLSNYTKVSAFIMRALWLVVCRDCFGSDWPTFQCSLRSRTCHNPRPNTYSP